MVGRIRLIMWRWVSRIHRTLHQAETFSQVYADTSTSDYGKNLLYDDVT
jgi:hypothetical protein